MVDLCIRNARLRQKGDELFDIAIADGRIADIGKRLGVLARDEIDAEGSLVTESFANPHLHLCKVWTLPMMNEAALAAYHGAGMGKALAAIDLAGLVKANPTTMPRGSRGMPAAPGPVENCSRPAIEPPGRLRRSTQLEASKQAHHGRRLPVATARRRDGALGQLGRDRSAG